jgi:hypothetical protein
MQLAPDAANSDAADPEVDAGSVAGEVDCDGSIERSSIAESVAASTADAALSSFSVR